MRDYLYIPLGGNKYGKVLTYRNLIIVFVLSGLWHGDNWTFIAWGVFHGAFLVFERVTAKYQIPNVLKFLRVPVIFFIVMMGWVLFRSESIHAAGKYYSALLTFSGDYPLQIYNSKLQYVLLIAGVFSFSTLTRLGIKIEKAFYFADNRSNWATVGLTLLSLSILALCVAYLSTGNFSPFIYFRF